MFFLGNLVICADGMTYERERIESWLSKSDTSPMCGDRLANKVLISNIALRIMIQEFEAKR